MILLLLGLSPPPHHWQAGSSHTVLLDPASGLTMRWQLSPDNSTMTWNMDIFQRKWFSIGICPNGLM